MITEEAINAIAKLAIATVQPIVKVIGKEGEGKGAHQVTHVFYNGSITEADDPPLPPVLELSTLHGLIDYLAENRDDIALDVLTLVVRSPTIVEAIGPVDEYGRRAVLARVKPAVSFPSDVFGHTRSQEALITLLQTWFRPTPERAQLLQTIGTLQGEAATTLVDDGVTQSVVAKARNGVGNVPLVNPVHLVPMRSFPEVDIGPSPYVVRAVGGGDGKPPSIQLHEADGGLWIPTATARVKAYLEKNGIGEVDHNPEAKVKHGPREWVVLA